MKNIIKNGKLLAAATALSLLFAGTTAQAQAITLKDKAKEAIYIALDDEYKAWSLYSAIMAQHGEVKPFSNIIRAEKRHANALIKLLKTYNLPVPKNPYEDGTKAKLVAPASVLEACKQGIQAEIGNVELYDEKIIPAVKGYGDISNVMLNLRNASEERHLPAFKRCVSRDGKMGRGHNDRGGQGMGRGHGGGKGGGMGQGRGHGGRQNMGMGGGHRRGNFD